MRKNNRIVIICPYLFRLTRGIERFCISLSKAFADKGYDVVIYAWGTIKENSCGEIDKRIKIRKVPYCRWYQEKIAVLFYRWWLRQDNPKATILNFLYHGEISLPRKRKYLYILHSPASQIPGRYEFVKNHIEDFENRIIYYESSRGCPFRCSYCLSSVEKTLRFRDVERVKKELAFFLEQEVAQVKFVDRTFNCRHEHAMEIWKFLIEHDNGVTNFHFEISADLLTDEEIALIGQMRPGLIQLEIGVQSTNDATITEIHRTMQLDRLKAVVRSIQEKENIHEHLDLIAGLPYEGYETFARSFDEIYALKPNQLQLGFLKVLKGSYMYEHATEYGLIYRSRPPYEVLKTNWLKFGEILRIRQVEEMLEVYYNSGQYATAIRLLETQYVSAFAMFAELGTFYEEHGYFGMGHSRMRRAEILLEFAKERRPGVLPVLGEGLVYDLYERENLGSRPAWAADANEWKQMTRQYGKNGKQSHIERFFYRFSGRRQDTVLLPERLEDPVYVRFDYTGRDPLDHQARHEYLEPSGE